MMSPQRQPETVLHISGRLEADETDIGAKTSGRVTAILVREGDAVKKGQIVIEMEDEEIPAQLSGLNAQIEAARQVAIPIYLWVSVMFGTMLGTRTNNQNAAVQGVALLGFLTALLLSGFIYPLSNIPFPLSLLPNIIPARYFIEITPDAYVRGTGWIGVWFAEVMIFVIGMVFFTTY